MERKHFRVAIVGTGFAGVGAAVHLLEQGIDDFVIFERAGDVGGTWRDNTYPGCQCDVPSHLYSFSFAPNPDWTRTYSMQPEIGTYIRRTAEQRGVLEHVRFNTPVQDAKWDDAGQHWLVQTPSGPFSADVLVMANGPLSEPKLPDVAGLERFEGTSFHSAAWNHDHDLTGERVAVIGTGASSIQFLPHVQQRAGHVTLFQRTAPWVLPHRDRAISRAERALYRRVPGAQRAVRALVYWMRELAIFGMVKNPSRMKGAKRMALHHLHKQVADAELRAKLTPEYLPGCKRLLLSNDYYPAVSQPNVDVVTSGITEIRARSVVTSDGTEHEVDTIIFGTGFHVTDNPVMAHVRGRDGRTLAEVWAETGMRAYKGTTVNGFPNMFFLAGPNTGIGHTSLVVMIEAQLRYLTDALHVMQKTGVAAFDVRNEAVEAFNDEVETRMAPSVWNTGGCRSWYMDSQGRNPTIWPDFTFKFVRATRRFDVAAYDPVPRRERVEPAVEALTR